MSFSSLYPNHFSTRDFISNAPPVSKVHALSLSSSRIPPPPILPFLSPPYSSLSTHHNVSPTGAVYLLVRLVTSTNLQNSPHSLQILPCTTSSLPLAQRTFRSLPQKNHSYTSKEGCSLSLDKGSTAGLSGSEWRCRQPYEHLLPFFPYDLNQKQELELREVRGGDEMRLHHLSEKLGVKLVGRKGLGPVADSVIASIKSWRANRKPASCSLALKSRVLTILAWIIFPFCLKLFSGRLTYCIKEMGLALSMHSWKMDKVQLSLAMSQA